MGEIIFSYNDLQGHTPTKPNLKLEAVVGSESFFYRIAEKDSDRSTVRYWKFPHKALSFFSPCNFLPEVFAQDDLLYERFESVTIALADVNFMLIPDQLLLYLKPHAILSRIQIVPAGDKVLCHQLLTDQSLIYSVPGKLLDELQLYFGDHTLTHIAQCLINNQLENASSEVLCIIYLLPDRFFLSLTKENKVLFAKQFHWRSPMDILYFCHLILQTFDLDQRATEIQICGPLASDDILSALKPWYPQTKYLPDFELQSMKPHFRIADLVTLHRCG